jgi:hypothetical protein
MVITSIETVIDNQIVKLQAQGFNPPPENLKSHYLKACWCLSKLQQKKQAAPPEPTPDKRSKKAAKGPTNDDLLIDLFRRELNNLRVRPA